MHFINELWFQHKSPNLSLKQEQKGTEFYKTPITDLEQKADWLKVEQDSDVGNVSLKCTLKGVTSFDVNAEKAAIIEHFI